MVLLWSAVLFVILTGMLYLLGVNVWLGPKTVIDRVSGQNWQAEDTAHPSLIFRDVLEKLGNMVPASPKDQNVVQKRLTRGGFRSPLAIKTFYGLKVGFLILMPILGFIVSLQFDSSNRIGILAVAAGLGYFGPN